MNTIKIYGILLLVLIVASSCNKDVLEVSSTTKVSAETFWKTESDATLAIDGVYNRVRAYTSNLLYTDALTDNAYNNYPWEGFKAIADGTHDPRNPGSINWFWDDCWRGIGRANTFLANIDAVNMDEAKKTVFKGEATFLRAYFYSVLVDFYGGVPLILEEPNLEHGQLPRSSKADVVNQIIIDLDDAAGMLPPTQSQAGRATEGAAIALKARVLLYNERWGEAATAANEVMGMNYMLYDSYRDLFKIENENNTEVIFDAQFKSPEVGNFYELYIGAMGTGGWASIVPLQELADAYETTEGYDDATPYENRDPRLRQTMFVPGSDYNSAGPLSVETPPNTYTGFCFKKYTPFDEGSDVAPTPYPTRTGNNVILIRLADVMLMYAEAKNEQSGPDASVYQAVNDVRARLSVNMPPLPAGLSKEEMREAIRHERRVELAFEGLHYADTRRWKTLESINQGLVDPGGTRTFNPARDYLWPIPGKEFDIDGTQLEQNPNYGN